MCIRDSRRTVAESQALAVPGADWIRCPPWTCLLYTSRAQACTDKAFTEILNFIKPGVTENEIAARLTYLMMTYGARKNSFDPIVASGPNGSMPHAIPTERKVGQGEFVTMDFGCMVEGYCSDMTRTVCVGQPTEEMVKVYNTCLLYTSRCV